MNDPSQILSLFLEGALGRSGRKRARKAARFVSGNKGLISASSLLAVAGVAWGIYDSMKSAAATPSSATAHGLVAAAGRGAGRDRERRRLLAGPPANPDHVRDVAGAAGGAACWCG